MDGIRVDNQTDPIIRLREMVDKPMLGVVAVIEAPEL